jgi:hypothetical protein
LVPIKALIFARGDLGERQVAEVGLEMVTEELPVEPDRPALLVRFDDVAEPLLGVGVEPRARRSL